MDQYKSLGNRKNEPPKHEMVHFPGLMSEKRSFGDFRTVLHTGLYSQIVAMEVPVGGDIGDEVSLTLLVFFGVGDGRCGLEEEGDVQIEGPKKWFRCFGENDARPKELPLLIRLRFILSIKSSSLHLVVVLLLLQEKIKKLRQGTWLLFLLGRSINLLPRAINLSNSSLFTRQESIFLIVYIRLRKKVTKRRRMELMRHRRGL